MLVVSSTDGFCSVIKFMPDEIGTAYSDEEADLEPLMALDDTDADLEPLDDSAIDADDELMLDDIDSDDDMVPVSKDGIPLNKVLNIKQSHCIEVAQGDIYHIFTEQNMRIGLVLGKLAMLKKNRGPIMSNL